MKIEFTKTLQQPLYSTERAGFWVLTTRTMKRDVLPCSLIEFPRRFGWTFCFYPEGSKSKLNEQPASRNALISCFAHSSISKIESIYCSETSVNSFGICAVISQTTDLFEICIVCVIKRWDVWDTIYARVRNENFQHLKPSGWKKVYIWKVLRSAISIKVHRGLPQW